MLEELLLELKFEFGLMIKDTADFPGNVLLKTLLKSMVNGCQNLSNIVIVDIDGFSNSWPTEGVNRISVDLSDIATQDLIKTISSNLPAKPCNVIFPSLSLLSLKVPIESIARLLRNMKYDINVNRVIAVYHSDVTVDEDIVSHIEYIFDSIISLQPLPPHVHADYHGYVQCTRHRPNGKLDMADEYYKLNSNYTFELLHTSSSAAIKSLVESSADITSQLTFNLSLSDKEKEARSKLQLPYLKKDEEKQALLGSTPSAGAPRVKIGDESSVSNTSTSDGGKIYYQYDEADDFDDEDPDDDLDI